MNYTYLARFYETEQPMPTWVAWHAHNMPLWFHKLCCVGMFVVELLGPILVLSGHRTLRNVGAVGMILFQFPLLLTGNYAILNLLTIVLCLPFFSFSSWDDDENQQIQQIHQKIPWLLRLVLAVHGAVGLLHLCRTIESLDYLANINWMIEKASFDVSMVSRFVPREVLLLAAAYRISNGYGGVFHDSFSQEGKIVLKLQGSSDGIVFDTPIQWRWHVHDVMEAPRFVAPHFPRLE